MFLKFKKYNQKWNKKHFILWGLGGVVVFSLMFLLNQKEALASCWWCSCPPTWPADYVVDRGTDWIEIKWNNNCGCCCNLGDTSGLRSYDLACKVSGEMMWTWTGISKDDGETTSASVDDVRCYGNVTPNITLDFQVETLQNPCGTGSTSELKYSTTAIDAPSNLVCSDITSSSIKVSAQGAPNFTNLSAGSSGLFFREADGQNSNWIQATSYIFSGFSPSTSYSFYVQARNREGYLTTEFGPVNCSTSAVPPDLTVPNQPTITGTMTAGQTLTFTDTVTNSGGSASGAFNVRYCIDNASCLTTTTGRVGSDGPTSLNAGATSSNITSAGWTAIAGNHTIYFCVDVGTTVNESDENNNCNNKTFTVATKPDLRAYSTATNPASPVPGNNTTFNAMVVNEGGSSTLVASSASFCLDLNANPYVDCDLDLGAYGISILAPTATDSIIGPISWTAVAGAHTARICADSVGVVNESDETDNCVYYTFTVFSQPDLIIVGPLSAPAGALISGNTLTFNATVKNQGGSASGVNSTTRFKIDTDNNGSYDVTLTDQTTGNLAANGTEAEFATWTAVAGIHKYQVCADVADFVDEGANEDNNCAVSGNFTVAAKPDLRVYSPATNPDSPVPGNDTTFNAIVINEGGSSTLVASSASFCLDLDANLYANCEVNLGADGISILAPTDTNLIMGPISWTAVAGAHTARICADSGGAVNESDETDNCVVKTFTVSIQPDLISENLSTIGSLTVGSSLGFSGTVKNQSSVNAAGISQTRLRIDVGNNGNWDSDSWPLPPANQPTGALIPNATEIEIWNNVWTVVAGTHKFEICADIGTAVAESSEVNNCEVAIFKVPADLIVENLSTIGSLIVGSPLDFFGTVKNQGGSNAGSTNTRLRVSIGNTSFWNITQNNSTNVLIPGAIEDEIFNFVAQVGTHKFEICADTTGAVNESNEGNNCASQVFTVSGQPDLIIENLSTIGVLIEGNALGFSGIVKNQGSVEAVTSETQFLLDINNDDSWLLPINQSTGVLASGTTEIEIWINVWTAQVGTHKYKICVDDTLTNNEENELNNCDSEIFTVAAAPVDFSLFAAPSAITALPTDTKTSAITVDFLNGYNKTVDLSISAKPACVTTAFSDDNFKVPPDSDPSFSTLTIDTNSCPIGSAVITVNGLGQDGKSHNQDIDLTIQVNKTGNTSGYAWGENTGWISFSCDHSGWGQPLGANDCAFAGGATPDYGVLTTDDALYGYAWGENIGWVSMNCDQTLVGGPTNCGIGYNVDVDINGNLYGYAWSENIGWINFDDPNSTNFYQVKINETGVFSGYAWSETAGYISFNSAGPPEYYVQTEWLGMDTPPQAPIPINPTDKQNDVSVYLEQLQWKSGDADGDNLEFDIYLDTAETPVVQLVDGWNSNGVLPNTIFRWPDPATGWPGFNLKPNTDYYWQVEIWDPVHGLIIPFPEVIWEFKTVKDEPDIRTSEDADLELNFGTVKIGATKTMYVVVCNFPVKDDKLTTFNISLTTGVNFSLGDKIYEDGGGSPDRPDGNPPPQAVDLAGISIDGGNDGKCASSVLDQPSYNIMVKFSPSAVAVPDDTLNIDSDDPDTANYQITLKGDGEALASPAPTAPSGGVKIRR